MTFVTGPWPCETPQAGRWRLRHSRIGRLERTADAWAGRHAAGCGLGAVL